MTETAYEIAQRITMSVFGKEIRLRVDRDQLNKESGRMFLQVVYDCKCIKTGAEKEWHGRKWYLSQFMTDDEVIKTAYAAMEAAVKHEVMEGFKVDGITLFNPHVNYQELLAISDREVRRAEQVNGMEI